MVDVGLDDGGQDIGVDAGPVVAGEASGSRPVMRLDRLLSCGPAACTGSGGAGRHRRRAASCGPPRSR